MKVFLSWSGKRSHAVAEALRDWLPDVINAVEPWLSSDIEKGAASMNEISASLKGSSFGIVCVTPGNQNTPWINYEAGALSKTVGDDPGRVATLLVGISRPTEVTGPLSQFQATKLELEDVTKLVKGIDKHTEKPREAIRIEKLVEKLWPAFKDKTDAALELGKPKSDAAIPRRSLEDKVDEVLELTRIAVRQGSIQRELIELGLYDTDQPFRMVTRREQANMQQEMAYKETVRSVTDAHIGKKETRGMTIDWRPDNIPVVTLPAPIPEELGVVISDEIETRTGIAPMIVTRQSLGSVRAPD